MQNRQIAHVWLGITLEQPHMYDRLAEHSHTAQTSEAVEALATPTSIRSGASALRHEPRRAAGGVLVSDRGMDGSRPDHDGACWSRRREHGADDRHGAARRGQE